jgi:hypothetical protein
MIERDHENRPIFRVSPGDWNALFFDCFDRAPSRDETAPTWSEKAVRDGSLFGRRFTFEGVVIATHVLRGQAGEVEVKP